MGVLITGLLASMAAWMVLWRHGHVEARGTASGRDAAVGQAVESGVAFLIVVHLCGYRLTGVTVLAILSTVGLVAESCPRR